MTFPVVVAIAGFGLLGIGLIGGGVKVAGNDIPPIASTWIRTLLSLIGLLFIGISIWLFRGSTNAAGVKPQTMQPAVSAQYDFESGTTGWVPQDYKDSLACVSVSQSKEHAKEGQHSLKMLLDLRGGDPKKSKGEAWVNMQNDPPIDVTAPVNLRNQTITAWVYAPPGAKGKKSSPNGLQLFVKDDQWRSLYGTWKNVIEDRWFKVTLTVGGAGKKKQRGGRKNSDFDPSHIVAVGLKVGTGGGSQALYKGPVYVDAVHW